MLFSFLFITNTVVILFLIQACIHFRREDDLDVEVAASGFTRKMHRDLNIEMGIEDSDSELEEDDVQDDLEALRNDVDSIIKEEVDQYSLVTNVNSNEEQHNLNNCSEEEENITVTQKDNIPHNDFEELHILQISDSKNSDSKAIIKAEVEQCSLLTNVDACEERDKIGDNLNNCIEEAENVTVTPRNNISYNDLEEPHIIQISDSKNSKFDSQNHLGSHLVLEEPQILQTSDNESYENLDTQSHFGFRSIRSTSTTSTIAPEVVKNRVKKALQRRDDALLKRRIRVKGEASAVTRTRRENRDTIKECSGAGIWGIE